MSSSEIVIYSPEVRSLCVRTLAEVGQLRGTRTWRIPVEMAGILVAEQPGLLRHIDSRLAEYVLLLRDHSSDQVQHASRWLTEILWAASRSTRARGKAEVSLRDVAICLQDLLDPEIEVEGMERDGVGGIDVVDTADVCWNIIREVQQGPDSDQTTTR